jgi:SsrA-binding protein
MLANFMASEMNNRQAYYHYAIEDKYIAGIVLMGTEVKSIREGKLSFNDAFCLFEKQELWVRGLYIAEYKLGTTNNHIAVHDRKLLLSKKELKRLAAKVKERGYSIVPLKVFFTDKQLVKVEIGLGRGKKIHDKRDTIKARDNDREMKRLMG